ncbi:MAG: hypothetical protein ACRDQ4_15125 [Pseudonocardiaceae bacterium]
MVLGVRRPGHHGVPHRPVTLAERAHRAARYRHRHRGASRGPGAAAVLGLLHRLPITRAHRRVDISGVGLICGATSPRTGDAHPELAAWTAGWVERIAALYTAHTALAAAAPGSSTHTMAAAQFSAALNTIDAYRHAQARHPNLLHPAATKVLATLDREWAGLALYRATTRCRAAGLRLRRPVQDARRYSLITPPGIL